MDMMDDQTVKTKKSRKSSSKSPSKKKKGLKTKKHVDEAPDEQIVVNNVNFAGFGQKNAAPQVVSPTNAEQQQLDQSIAPAEEQKSKKSKKGKKRGSRSSSAQRQRSKSGDDDDTGPQEDHLKPDFEAEAIERKPRQADTMRVNKADLFKPVSQIEREKKALEYEARDDKSTKTKKKGKKSKKGKKKGKKGKNNEDGEDEEFDDESEESSDADDTDEEERIKKQKGERD